MSIEVTAEWFEDGSATVYGRLMARDGTGTRIDGQGRCLKKADIASITFKVFDLSAPDTVVNSGTVSIGTCVFDTLQTNTDDSIWKFSQGFNFRHDLGPENFPTGGRVYTVEYKITTTGGAVGWAVYKGPAVSVLSS